MNFTWAASRFCFALDPIADLVVAFSPWVSRNDKALQLLRRFLASSLKNWGLLATGGGQRWLQPLPGGPGQNCGPMPFIS